MEENTFKKKVGIILPSLQGGGAERVIVNIANGLINLDCDVDLVLVNAKGPFLKYVDSRIKIINLNSPRLLYAIPKIIGYIRKNKANAILSVMNYVNLVVILCKILSFANVRLIASLHNNTSVALAALPGYKSTLMKMLMKALYPSANGVISVSTGVNDDFLKIIDFQKDKTRVIYNPIITDELIKKGDEALSHRWFVPLRHDPVVVSVGRLTEQKNFINAINAIHLVNQSKKINYIILGEGEDRQKLENSISALKLTDRIELPGFVDNPYKYIKNCDVFLLSSKWEGLPTVLIEALAMDVKIVSTNCPSGPFEILEGGKLGKLVEVNNCKELADSIIDSLNTLVEKKTQYNLEKYTIESVAEFYYQFIFESDGL